MNISLTYPEVPPFEVPERNLMAVLAPRVQATRTAPSVADLTLRALDHPAESPPLESLASKGTRVLLLVDDITRQTPAGAVLPPVLDRLLGAGVDPAEIRILIAAGTHAHMTPSEIETKLGPEIPRRHGVTLHHWRDEANLREIGATADGTPIRVNRLLGQADLVVGVGQIVPHRVMGFTGGSTIVQPGVSGPEVTGYTHWMSAFYAGPEIVGIASNPVRLEVERIARLAGLRFIVNVVMDGQERVLHVVAGDPVAAHRQGAELSRQIYGAPQPQLAEIVVAESYPADYDLWQAAKGIYASELAVRPGGVVILVTRCRHGVAEEHPEVEQLGYLGFEEVKAGVERGELRDKVAAAHLVHVGRVIRDKAQGIMVSPGIRTEVQKHLGFRSAPTPQEALDLAFSLAGRDARVVVLRQGGHVLPQIEERPRPVAS